MSNHSPSTYRRTFSAPARPPVYVKGNPRPRTAPPAAQEPAPAPSAERDTAAEREKRLSDLQLRGLSPGMAAYAIETDLARTPAIPAPAGQEAKALQLRGLTPGMAAFAAGRGLPGIAPPSVGSGLSPGLAAFAEGIKLPA